MAWTAPRTWVSGEVVTAALLNTHVRDNEIELGPGTGSAWTTYTPTYAGFTIGVLTYARYRQVGKLTTVQWQATVATTSGAFTVSLPVSPAASYNLSRATVLGIASGLRGTASQVAAVYLATATTVAFNSHGGGDWSNSVPVTWLAADPLGFTITYEAA